MNRWVMGTLAVAAIAVLGWTWWSLQSGPNANGAAGDLASPLVEVRLAELSPAGLAGQANFQQYCQSCHGVNAAGQEGVAPPLVHRIYEPSHHGDGAFYSAALIGARAHHWPFGDMPPVEGVTQDEVTEIIAYVRELQRANGIL